MVMENSGGRTIVERAKSILLKPTEEWPVIAGETTSGSNIFMRYAVPLALIGPVCSFLHGQLFGFGAFGFHYRPSFMGSLSMAIGSFVLSLIGLFVLSFIAGNLANRFGGESNSRAAFKLVVYSMTAGWVVGVFSLIPSLGFLAILGLYGFYLFYTGAGPLMKIPADKQLIYTILTFVCAIVLYFVVGALAAAAGRMFGGGMMGPWGAPATHSTSDGTLSLPGGATIDTGKIEQAAQDMESAVKGDGGGKTVAASDLQALLPGSIGSYTRTATESTAIGPMGSHAEGTYKSGDKSFTLSVTDLAAVGAMASIGTAFGIEQNKEDADSYEHTTTKDGNLIIEKWNRTDKSGTYGTMVDKRFMIEAEGDADSIDGLKAAVASIDPAKLVALAR